MFKWLYFILVFCSTALASTDCLVRGFEGQFVEDKCVIKTDKISENIKALINCPIEKACHPVLFGKNACLPKNEDSLKSNLSCLENSSPVDDVSYLVKSSPEFLEHYESIYQEFQIFCNKDFGDPRNQVYCTKLEDQISSITQNIQNQSVVISDKPPVTVDENGEINISNNFSNNLLDILNTLDGKPARVTLGEIQKPDTLGLNDERRVLIEKEVKILMQVSLCKYQNEINIENLDDIMKIAHKLYFSNEYKHDKELMQSTFCLLEKYYLSDFEKYAEEFDQLMLRTVQIKPQGMDACL